MFDIVRFMSNYVRGRWRVCFGVMLENFVAASAACHKSIGSQVLGAIQKRPITFDPIWPKPSGLGPSSATKGLEPSNGLCFRQMWARFWEILTRFPTS